MQEELTLPPLAVSGGDPAGIGLEITIRAWREREAAQLPPFVLYADADAVAARAAAMGCTVPLARLDVPADAARAFAHHLPVIDVATLEPPRPGRPSAANATATIAAIEQATAAVERQEARALVTNPIAKNVLYGAGFAHPGHTEFLAAIADRTRAGQRHVPVMMLAAAELRVVPLTIHVPLARVPQMITQELIETTVRITAAALARDFGLPAARIAIAGLNPHAGEAGTIGREDADIIAPVIARLKGEGLALSGPHSADTLFHAEARATYDAVIAMYHDQALIPIKTLAFDRGVNVTLGLPFVRTSPDHGTAFDIADRFIARPTSFIEAVRLADFCARRRSNAARRP